MANKKINQLAARVGLADNDLLAVGDPDYGYLYKVTVSDLLAVLSPSIALRIEEVTYTANGTEGSSVTIAALDRATIMGVYRSTRYKKVLSSPASGQVVFTSVGGTLNFSSLEPLVAGETIIIDKISL